MSKERSLGFTVNINVVWFLVQGSQQSRDSTSEDAARNRILPENINQDAAERARQKINNQRRKKHVQVAVDSSTAVII